jgi:hypothetical protein
MLYFITKYSLSLLFSHALPFPETQERLVGTSSEINSTVRYGRCDPVRHVDRRLRFRVSHSELIWDNESYRELVGHLWLGISPSQGRMRRITQTEVTHTSMSRTWFETATPLFEWTKICHVLDRAATLMGCKKSGRIILLDPVALCIKHNEIRFCLIQETRS